MVDVAVSDDRNIATTDAWKIAQDQEFSLPSMVHTPGRSCSGASCRDYRGPWNSLERLC